MSFVCMYDFNLWKKFYLENTLYWTMVFNGCFVSV